jgi:signal transduction histidine kinase
MAPDPVCAEGPSEILRSVATLAVAASHEINNPLMTLIASLELLEKTQTLDAYGQARLSVALAAAWEIKEAVRQLGRITRFELAAGGPNLPSMLDLEKSSQILDG